MTNCEIFMLVSLGVTFIVYVVVWGFSIVRVTPLHKYLKEKHPSIWGEITTSKIFGFILFNPFQFEKFLRNENIDDQVLLQLRDEYRKVRNIGIFIIICFAVQILAFSVILAILQ